MSLIRLGSAATRRQVARSADLAAGKADTAANMQFEAARQEATRPETETTTEKSFEQLVQYFPTETVTLFLAAVSLVKTLEHIPWILALRPFGLIAIFTVLTPLMLLLAAYATFREEKRAKRIAREQPFQVPTFDLFASAAAFVPWALAVPGLFPEQDAAAQSVWTAETIQVLAAFGAFATSWFLSQLRRIVAPI